MTATKKNVTSRADSSDSLISRELSFNPEFGDDEAAVLNELVNSTSSHGCGNLLLAPSTCVYAEPR